MKKFVVVCLSIAMMLSMSVSALAAGGSFVKSPSANDAPVVVSFDPADDDCTARLIVTPYSERDKLDDEYRAMLEKAYNDIVNSSDLTKLCDALDELAKKQNIVGSDLAVSDLFSLHSEGCDHHDGHHDFDIVLAADTLENFVGLMYMNENGEWVLVEDAKVIDGNLHFSVDFAITTPVPFAIVVNTNTGSGTPQTGDHTMILFGVMAAAAAGLVVIAVTAKKRKS